MKIIVATDQGVVIETLLSEDEDFDVDLLLDNRCMGGMMLLDNLIPAIRRAKTEEDKERKS